MTPHVRPAFKDVLPKTPVYAVICSCGEHIQFQEGLRVHWERGHFDRVDRSQEGKAAE